jgi:CBS domain-containing protein
VTDRDLAMATHLQGVPLHESRVTSAMAREVRCCLPTDSPATVQTLMQHHKIRRVPVVDADRRLVGIVSLGDLAYLMGSEQTQGGEGLTWTALAHTLAAVSTPRLPRYRR